MASPNPEPTNPIDNILENNPELAQFFKKIDEANQALDQAAKINREEAQKNMPKFKEEFKKFIQNISNLKLPQCYILSVDQLFFNLQQFEREEKMAMCQKCSYRVGAIKVFSSKPQEQQPETAAKIDDIEKTTAEQDKKINLYYPEQPEEKAADVKRKADIETLLQQAKTLMETIEQTAQDQGIRDKTLNFDEKWAEYVSFLKNTEPNILQLSPSSITQEFQRYIVSIPNSS